MLRRGFVQSQSVVRSIGLRSVKAPYRFYSSGPKRDQGFSLLNFLVVSLLATGIFVVVVHKVDEQDSTQSMLKRKNTFTDQEWEQYMNSIKRKVWLFKPTTEIYFVPTPKEKELGQLVEKLGGESLVNVVDLNDVIEDELKNHYERYGALLETHLVGSDNGYQFDNRLSKGIFSKLMRLKLEQLRESGNEDTKYVLKNFPNNLQEAIKFESDVAVLRKLVLFDDAKTDLTDYFDTVKKTYRVGKVTDDVVSALRST